MPVILDIGVNNAELRAGLQQAESMVDAAVKRITVRMNKAGQFTGATMAFAAPEKMAAQSTALGLVATRMEKVTAATGGLNSALGRMTGIFSGGLGITAALGGLSLLGAAFGKAITMAQRFQTAQISIGAILLSTYKVKGAGGKEADPMTGFMFAHEQALKYNTEIIQRSRKNILTYEEQLKAFQVGLAAGGRKGIAPEKVMDISEQIAVGAKAIGLQGERIGEQVRILLGGGVNVQRSMFAKILGITSKDISSRSGDELVKFIQSRMKGFQSKGILDEFNTSIQKIITTMQSQIDVFLAGVGTQVMKKLAKPLAEFGGFLEGPNAAKLGDALVTGFTNIASAVETIAKSPAIPLIGKFISFLASEADKIVIGAVLLKLASILTTVGAGVAGAIAWFNKLGASAATAAGEVNGLAAAEARVGEAGLVGSGRIGGFGMGAKGVAGAAEGALLSEGQQAGITALMARGTPQAEAQARNLAKGMYAKRVGLGQTAAGQEGALEALLAGGGVAEEERMGLMGRAKKWGSDYTGTGFEGGIGENKEALMGGLGKLGSALMAGGMAYGGIKMGAAATGMGDQDTSSGIITDIAANSAAVGLAVGQFNVLAGVIAAAATGVATLAIHIGELGKQTEDANDAFEKTKANPPKVAPQNKAVVALMNENTRLAKIVRGETPTVEDLMRPSGPDNFQLSRTEAEAVAAAARRYKPSAKEREAAKAQIAVNIKKQAALGAPSAAAYAKAQKESYETGSDVYNPLTGTTVKAARDSAGYPTTAGLHFETPAQAANLKDQKDAAEANLKALESGQGTLREKQTAYWKFSQRATEIRTALANNEITVIDKDLVAKEKQRAEAEALISKAKRGEDLTKKEKSRLLALQHQEQTLQQTQASRYINEARGKLPGQYQAIDLKHKEALELGDNDRSLEAQYRKGLANAQRQVMAQRAELGPDFASTMKKVVANFNESFDMPLKKIQQQMQNLDLGVSADNVVEHATLAFQEIKRKIYEAVHVTHDISVGMGQKFFEQRQTEYIAELHKPELERQQFNLEQLKRPYETALQHMALPEANLHAGQAKLAQMSYEAKVGGRDDMLADIQAQVLERKQRAEESYILRNPASREAMMKTVEAATQTDYEKLQTEAKKADLEAGLAAANDRLIPILNAQADAAAKVRWNELADAVPAAAAKLREIAGRLDKHTAGSALGGLSKAVSSSAAKLHELAGGHPDHAKEGSHTFNIDVGTGGFTEKDIDRWVPAIREKLCKLAAQSGGRG